MWEHTSTLNSLLVYKNLNTGKANIDEKEKRKKTKLHIDSRILKNNNAKENCRISVRLKNELEFGALGYEILIIKPQ